ncbi:MAG: acylphosphatase [Deltaproteobacteria bacterium]|nr:acylphosphatase [Deltaproteobacteria bacterium]MBW2418797.1 acylphosphatase [Deltaproteobacteria bacterium]
MRRVRTRVVVSGRVQGVWFRESTRRCAEELGLQGWVRNLPDGRVEAELVGAKAAVLAALEFVKCGPEHARVEACEVAPLEEVAPPEEVEGAGSPRAEAFRILR